jgi:hypothetical protein
MEINIIFSLLFLITGAILSYSFLFKGYVLGILFCTDLIRSFSLGNNLVQLKTSPELFNSYRLFFFVIIVSIFLGVKDDDEFTGTRWTELL